MANWVRIIPLQYSLRYPKALYNGLSFTHEHTCSYTNRLPDGSQWDCKGAISSVLLKNALHLGLTFTSRRVSLEPHIFRNAPQDGYTWKHHPSSKCQNWSFCKRLNFSADFTALKPSPLQSEIQNKATYKLVLFIIYIFTFGSVDWETKAGNNINCKQICLLERRQVNLNLYFLRITVLK